MDIVAIISEKYVETEEIEISSDCISIIETLVDSIYGNDCLEHENKKSEKLNSILIAKMDSLQIDIESIEYFYDVLGLKGKLYNLGLEYVYKLTLVLNQYVKDRFSDILLYLTKKITDIQKINDKYFDFE